MKIMVVFGALLLPSLSLAQTNRVKNFSFEIGDTSPAQAQNWSPMWKGYERASSTPVGSWDGNFALKVSQGSTPSDLAGALQKIVFNQSTPVPVLITARIKGQSISNISTDKYGASLYCRVRYKSGDTDYCPTTSKTKHVGSFDWRHVGLNTATLLRGHLAIDYVEVIPMLGPVPGTAWFDDVHVAEYPFGTFQGAVTVILDDGFKEHRTYMVPKMAQHGWKGTLAAVSNYLLSGDPEYMNLDDLFAMKNAGWEIVSHSVDHSDMVAIGIARAEDQYYFSKRFFNDRGITVKSFILPFGSYNAEVLGRNDERGYYSAVRKVERGYNPMGSFPYDIKIQELKSTTTFNEMVEWINQAKIRKAWLVILLHKIRDSCPDPYCTSPLMVDNMLSLLQGSALPVVTFDAGLTLVKSPR